MLVIIEEVIKEYEKNNSWRKHLVHSLKCLYYKQKGLRASDDIKYKLCYETQQLNLFQNYGNIFQVKDERTSPQLVTNNILLQILIENPLLSFKINHSH